MKVIEYCPCCGSRETMKYKDNIVESYNTKKCGIIVIEGLDGHFCSVCGDGFFSEQSEGKIEAHFSKLSTFGNAAMPVSTASSVFAG